MRNTTNDIVHYKDVNDVVNLRMYINQMAITIREINTKVIHLKDENKMQQHVIDELSALVAGLQFKIKVLEKDKPFTHPNLTL